MTGTQMREEWARQEGKWAKCRKMYDRRVILNVMRTWWGQSLTNYLCGS